MKSVITIGRQFGSGGHEIGSKLSEKYNIPIYDKELISVVAKESGICEEMIRHHEEKPTNSFLYNLVMDTYNWRYSQGSYAEMPIAQRVFLAQYEAIKKLADEGPCIIVGRCADYALAEHPNAVNIFINADMDFRIQNVMKRFDLAENKAKEMINKKDKERQSYYNYYSDKKWGASDSYHLTIDSSKLGIDKSVELIDQYIKIIES